MNRMSEHDRQRYWTSPETSTPEELLVMIRQRVADDNGDWGTVTVSRGVYVRWMSPETEEEREGRLVYEAEAAARKEEWELATYERLFAKYAGLPPSTAIGVTTPR